MTAPGLDRDALQAQALAGRMFVAGLTTAELFAAYLGVRLGLYEALAAGGPATASQLAERAGINRRYAREWLEQQAVSGVLEVNHASRPPEDRLYLLPAGHAEALTDPDSLSFIAPMVLLPVGGLARVLPLLIEAYRTGGGVPYEDYGDGFHAGQGLLNRAVFIRQLPHWIQRGLPELDARLRGGCRAADVACGAGWSTIALAQTYPKVTIDGFDLHAPSVAQARRNATAFGVSDRVTFTVGSGAGAGAYELVCIFDALHDMARPLDMLRACRALLAEGGSLLLLEPNARETFAAPGDEVERFLYAVSLLHCLPVGLSEQPSCATGTVMRPETIRRYAFEAGFTCVAVVPIDHRFHRLYHLST